MHISMRSMTSSLRVPRCANCAAYITAFANPDSHRWFCALCEHRNTFDQSQIRQRQHDGRLQHESKSLLVDYRMPIAEASVANGRSLPAIEWLPVASRPLVHVFLVQESMRLDTMQAAVEALSQAVPTLHPDMRVVFLTFSNRIGIHSFAPESAVPSVQYVHFASTASKSNSNNSSSSVSGISIVPSSLSSGATPATVFEGREMHEIAPQYEVRLQMPLSRVAGFLQTAASVGECCDSLVSAASSLFDAYPSEAAFGGSDDTLPRAMLGPALEAVADWILEPPAAQDAECATMNDEVDEDEGEDGVGGGGGYGSSLQEGLAQIFGKLGLGGNWASSSSSGGGGGGGGASQGGIWPSDIRDPDSRRNSPIDICNGVVLHLFIDSPHDLRGGAHDSVSATDKTSSADTSPNGLSVPRLLDVEWATRLGRRCAERSLCINLWATSSFEKDEIGLCALDPLASLTGGSLCRVVLGFYPKDGRDRLTEQLRRSLSRPYASRCLLKLRASPIVDFSTAADCVTGPLTSDPNLPGVYRIASCSPDSTLGFQFAYKPHVELNTRDSEGPLRRVVLQVAFSYEALVEGAGEDDRASAAHRRANSTGSSSGGSGNGKRMPTSESLLSMGLCAEDVDEDLSSSRDHRDGGAQDADAVMPPDCATSESYLNSVTSALELAGVRDLAGSSEDDHHHDRTDRSGKKYSKLGRTSPVVSVTCRDGPYDRRRGLRAVKFLRVISVMVECTPKATRLFQMVHIPTMMCLATRGAFAANRRQCMNEASSPLQPHQDATEASSRSVGKLSVHKEGVKQLVNFAVRFLIGCAKCSAGVKWAGGKGHKHVSLKELLDAPDAETLFRQMLDSDPLVAEVVTRAFSAADLLESLLQRSSAHSQSAAAAAPYLCDEAVDVAVQLLSMDAQFASRVLYPQLVPLSACSLLLERRSIPLSRFAMMTSAGAFRYFLLDSGFEVALYRNVAAATTTTNTAVCNGVTGGDHNAQAPLQQSVDVIEQLSKLMAAKAKIDSGPATTVENEDSATLSAMSEALQRASQQSFFLLNYLSRRLQQQYVVPRIHLCDAGMQSAGYFSEHLLEDTPRGGAVGVQAFKELVVEIVLANAARR